MKRCPGCGETKALAEFGNNRAAKDGLQTWCKPCHRVAKANWSATHVERKRELGRQWYAAHRESELEKDRLRYDPEKARAFRRRWYVTHAESAKRINRRSNIQRYGLTEASFAAMVAAQGGVCAICKQPPKKKRLHIDHCHKAGKVRALLCSNCNLGIGNLQDSASLLRAAAEYLESFDRSPEE